MHEANHILLPAALFAFASLIGTDAQSAQLEGALQYPPPSIGEDAQPPPPARVVPSVVSPRRIELGVSGSSQPPGTKQFLKPPAIHGERSGQTIPSNAGGS